MTFETAKANGIEIAYETFGPRDGEPLVLVMGLGAQLISWHEAFCGLLADRGYLVVRFDNRDAGESTHITDAPDPDIGAAMHGEFSSASYTLTDMAADTAGLMDALDLGSAHIVGASMGGMIAQQFAISYPERTRSLTSIMSTPSPKVAPPTKEAMGALMMPPATTPDEAADRAMAAQAVIGSPGFAVDEPYLRDTARRAFGRSNDPKGFARQLVAIHASGDRSADLARVTAPTVVIHGAADPLVTPPGGEATAAAVPGAKLVVIDGMGHSLPREIWNRVADEIDAVAAASTSR